MNGWVEKTIAEIAPLQRGFDLPTSEIISGDYPIVYSNGIGESHNIAMAKSPGVVTGRSGTIGSLTYVEDDFFPHNTTLWVTDFKGNDEKFIYYLFHLIEWQKYATGSGVPTLNRNDVHELKMLIPETKSEQRRIAAVLSDTDKLITALEKLIAKKRAIKQGAMQELLTGKRRLPGFGGEWAERKLGDAVDVYDNLRIPVTESQRKKGQIPYYGANGIQDYVHGYTHDGEFVLLAEDGANDLKNYPINYVYGKVWVNNHAHAIQGLSGIADTKYLSYSLKIVDFQSVLVGGTRAKLNGSTLREVVITIPLDTTEQSAIAEILSDMDAEIDALTEKLNKYKRIKQGMMSELLTGRIRLLGDGEEVSVNLK